jgi:catechol 2,3-dioxygenase-like lactoylglutathione lyase family enzyme
MGLAPMSAGERSSFLRCGNDFLALFKADRPGMDHFCFTVEGYEPADAVKRLQGAGLNPRRQADRVYFDDPDGLEVQVSAPNQ